LIRLQDFNNGFKIPAKILVLCFITLVSFWKEVYCQPNDSTILSTLTWFDQTIGIENSGVVNGAEYKIARLGGSSTPFFESGESNGTVVYNNQRYNAVLLYDIFQDALVLKHFSKSGRVWLVELHKEMVEEFIISNRTFRKFDRGYHELLFEGRDFSVVARRSKAEKVQNGIFNYYETDQFFIVEHGNWKPLTGKSRFEKMLKKADKPKLNSFLHEHHIKINKFRKEDLVQVAKFIESLRYKPTS
jgi:hypothetical protein